MTLGFDLTADPVRKGLFGYRPQDTARIAATIAGLCAEDIPEIAPLVTTGRQADGTWRISIMPIGADLVLAPEHGKGLTASAATGHVGPGYHAWLIDILDRAAQAHGLKWVDSGAGDASDETLAAPPSGDRTGYFADRDLEQLRFRFREHVAVEAGTAVAEWDNGDDVVPFGTAMPVVPAEGGQCIATLRGPIPRVAAECARSGSDEDAQLFYPWWEMPMPGRGPDKPTCLNLAEALLWVAFPWRAPLSPREKAVAEAARALLTRAGPGEAGEIPVDELETLMLTETPTQPRAEGIGYLRGTVTRALDESWRIRLPGWFRRLPVDENGIQGWWFEDREVHVLPIPLDRSAPSPDPKALLAASESEIAFLQGDTFYEGRISMHHGPSGAAPEFTGLAVCPRGKARIWILFPGSDASEWVLRTFGSLRMLAPADLPDLATLIPATHAQGIRA